MIFSELQKTDKKQHKINGFQNLVSRVRRLSNMTSNYSFYNTKQAFFEFLFSS